jgi:hypothetical protein
VADMKDMGKDTEVEAGGWGDNGERENHNFEERGDRIKKKAWLKDKEKEWDKGRERDIERHRSRETERDKERERQ